MLVHFKGIGLEALSGALESQLELLLSPSFPSLFKAEWLYGTCQLTSERLVLVQAPGDLLEVFSFSWQF